MNFPKRSHESLQKKEKTPDQFDSFLKNVKVKIQFY